MDTQPITIGPGSATAEPLAGHALEACADTDLVAAIRECEDIRRRALADQLALLTEARRRGLDPAASPRLLGTPPGPEDGT